MMIRTATVTDVTDAGVWVISAWLGAPTGPLPIFGVAEVGDAVLVARTADGELAAVAGAAGVDGADGADGEGVPTGGSTGQLLRKSSATDFDTAWFTGLPTTSTDNTVARFDGTGGALQGSGVTISDADAMTVPGNLTVQKDTAPEFKLRSTGAEIYNTIDTYTSYYNDIKYRGSIRWSLYLVSANNWTLRRYDDAGASLGDALTIYRADGKVRIGAPAAGLELGSSGPRIMAGSGSPESVVSAPVGSLWLRTDGSTTTTLYVKTSGTGNTGWTAK